MRPRTLIQDIASTIVAYKNCIAMNNTLWQEKHLEHIHELQEELPSGSGIDCGTKIDIDRSNGSRVVLTCEYHHMNESGYYDGWTEHTIYVTPSFDGIDLHITGRNRNEIKDYLHETLYWTLQQVRRPDGCYCDGDIYQIWIDESMHRVAGLHSAY